MTFSFCEARKPGCHNISSHSRMLPSNNRLFQTFELAKIAIHFSVRRSNIERYITIFTNLAPCLLLLWLFSLQSSQARLSQYQLLFLPSNNGLFSGLSLHYDFYGHTLKCLVCICKTRVVVFTSTLGWIIIPRVKLILLSRVYWKAPACVGK